VPNEHLLGPPPFNTVIAGGPIDGTVQPPQKSVERPRMQSVRSGSPHGHRTRHELTLLAGVAVLTAIAVVIARSGLYTAGSDLGYWLGFAGGVGILTLFLYPLRKRWTRFREMGSTRFWFSMHMGLGICGPLVIVAHSTLAFGSLNATIAFASMALVAMSGIAGRFLYGRIHHGLYGRRTSLGELRNRLGMDSAAVHSKLSFVPKVEARLAEFAILAEETGKGGLGQPLRFMTLGWRAKMANRWCGEEVTRALFKRAAIHNWSKEKLSRRVRTRTKLVAAYLRAAQRVAQFGVFERMFSWWHILHVPLVYMMVMSVIAHVVAVHMY
jgi:hypothetical protein